MITFDNLKNQWGNQSSPETPIDGAKQIANKMKTLRTRQWTTIAIISITVLVLIGFFFYISAYMVPIVTIGLLLMIIPLIFRVGLEGFSIKTLENIDVSIDTSHFRDRIVQYYKSRMVVHFIATPIIFGLYITGFILLMPSFKANLSSGFYTYIQISSVVVLLALAFMIAQTIKKEIQILKNLQHKV